MKKRILSMLLCLCMVLALFPTTAFAEESDAFRYAQSLIDALPDADTITAENRADVEARLTAIDEARLALDDNSALDYTRYQAAIAAINVLDNRPGAEVAGTVETKSLEGATVSVTKTFQYNGARQKLMATDVAVTLADGTPLTADDFTLTATAQTSPGNYSFTVTGAGNYTGTVNGNWSIQKGTLADQDIYLMMKEGETSITVNVAEYLPDWGTGSSLNQVSTGNVGNVSTREMIATIEPAHDPESIKFKVQSSASSYYKDFYVTLHIVKAVSAQGEAKDLNVFMADRNIDDKPNTPTVTGLPATPYNYKVTYAKKNGDSLTGVPKEPGEYTVTVTCDDLVNNTYSGSADFSIWLKVTLDANEGLLPTGVANTYLTTTGKMDTLPEPTRNGYTFLGWYTEKKAGEQVSKETVYSENTTLYAHWLEVIPEIGFSMSGYGNGMAVSGLKLTLNKGNKGVVSDYSQYGVNYWISLDAFGCAGFGKPVDSSAKFLRENTYHLWVKVELKEGYDAGWPSNFTLNGNEDEAYTMDSYVYTVVFQLPTAGCIITLDPNGGKLPEGTDSTVATNADGKLTSLPTPTREGYSFDGWSTEKGSGEKVTVDKTYSENTTLYARWKAKDNIDSIIPYFFTIHADAGVGGSISFSGNNAILCGSSKTFTVTPDSGYAIADVIIDGRSIGAVTSYTFSNVMWNHTITVLFTKIEETPVTDEPVEDNPLSGNSTIIPFTDVNESDWFCEDVAYVYDNGLMKGTGETAFEPYATTTRGMIVTILYRLEGEPALFDNCPFDDVKSGSYYEKAITWAAANGIVSGYGDGKFGSDDPITREQMAIILYRYAIYKKADVSVGEDTDILNYHDAQDVSEYAFSAMQWICGEGILNGSDGNLMPRGYATRAQVAAILHRFCEKILK